MWDFRYSGMLSVLSAKCMKVTGLSQPSATGLRHWLTQSSVAANTVKGKNVAAFTNKEEEEVHTTDVVPYLLETALREHGALHHEAPNWSENVVTDGRLITGQNPASAHGVGVALLNALRQPT